MSSSFDVAAAARPVVDEPTVKKWLPSKSSTIPDLDVENQIISVISIQNEQDLKSTLCLEERLSWQSIESFDASHCEMEALVVSLKKNQLKKGRFFSAFTSLSIVFFFGYIVASFFTSAPGAESSSSDSIAPVDGSSMELLAYHQSPKFLLTSFNLIQQPSP
ncbi:MAG: hypothetical protein ACI8RD_003155 [Bacillariaceae sp.]|jgi:hypothetical protein